MASDNAGEHNPEITGYDCALCEEPNHADSHMIYCEKCHKWFHFKCVNVTEEVRNISWTCEECRGSKNSVDETQTPDQGNIIVDVSDSVDNRPQSPVSQEVAMKHMGQAKVQEDAELQHKRELQQMKADFERQCERETEKMMLQLHLERQLLKKKMAVEAELNRKRGELYNEFQCRNAPQKPEEGAVGGQMQTDADLEEMWRSNFNYPIEQNKPIADIRGAVPKCSTPKKVPHLGNVNYNRPLLEKVSEENAMLRKNRSNATVDRPPMPPQPIPQSAVPPNDLEQIPEPIPDPTPGMSCPPSPYEYLTILQEEPELTRAQIAARKGPFAKLPIFTGKSEEWPLFISSFNNGNSACNWTNLENLGRLQESIKGQALEAVRSRLLLPESVPKVIETLRLLYGRPEQLLHSLIQKARKADPPRIERFASFISYGMVVQQLCDHLVASGLVDHLVNPMLIAELVEKLPPSTKLEWVRYKRQQDVVNLSTLSDFLSEIVSEATEATLYTELQMERRPIQERQIKKLKGREHQGFLNTHHVEQSSLQLVGQQKNPNQYDSRKPCRGCNRTDHRIRLCEDFRKQTWNERMKIADKWKLCQLCLNEHGQIRCRFKGHCNVGDCKERHHPLLHPPNSTFLLSTNCNVHNSDQHPVIFRVVPIKLHNGRHVLDVIAFLDEGSSYSLMESSVAEQIKLCGVWKPILVKWTAGMNRLERDSKCVDVSISAKDCEEKFLLRNVHTVQQLQLPEQEVRFAEITARFKHLSGLPITECLNGPPRILIGLKHLHVYAPLESRIGNPGEPIAVRTKLGWTIYGPQCSDDTMVGFAGHHIVGESKDQGLQELLRKYFTVEESGLAVTVLPESTENIRARKLLEQTTTRVGERFETGLLWKNDDPQLPDNYAMAVKRMQSLERKLSKNPELRQNVESQIKDYQNKGYAHIATEKELMTAEPGKVWYLPLNVVLNPKKPGKVRLVWDAAASVQGKSLNSELIKGPDLLSSLPSVLCPFRERPIAFGGDIAEMYHQLQIRPNDRSAQRFLFRPTQSGPPVIYVMDVATFGSTSSPCSAQYIKNQNAREFTDQFPDAVEAIIHRHYVDDYLDSTFTVGEAIKRASEVTFIHSKAGFKLRNWVSNSTKFLQHFGGQTESRIIHFGCDKSNNTERVLGMSWNTVDDVFVFATVLRDDLQAFLTGGKLPTKRTLLRIVMSFFDPLGLWALFTVFGKIIIQDLWRNGCPWDELLDENSARKWIKWIALLPKVQSMEIPRCYFLGLKPSDHQNLELHVFADASEEAYGSVAYFRIWVNGHPRVALVSAKSKVAPLQYMSIPRMELLAAVLAARLSVAVKANHSVKVKRLVIHIDSATVLSWIRSDHRKYKQFVAYRIGEILSLTSPIEWCWVASKNNIADVLTKWGKNGPPLITDGEWVRGPDILYQSPEECWQKELPAPDVKEELRAYLLFHEISFAQCLVDTTRFSRWKILIRTVACVFRFISNCHKKIKKLPIESLQATVIQGKLLKSTVPSIKTPLKCEEYRQAEDYLWKIAQQEGFADERKTLLKNRELPQAKWHVIERCSPLYRLSPFLDESGVIRMEGRSAHADFLPFEQRCPIVLPKSHDVTTKLLLHYHEKFGHANRETVVNELRQRFSIPYIRAAVLKVMKDCAWCKIHKCHPTVPRMAPLPIQRLTPQHRPFSFVGVDYFGPVVVTVGRRSEKRWICLFTCLVTRAIHMEITYSMSSQSCVMAIRRFICRRGAPLEYFSDNGTNFRAASKELVQKVRCIELDCADVFTDARTRWNFNPPAAPHMGGIWERLVRSAKDALKALHDGGKLTDEILLTVLAEAEDMVNSRPLTYVPQESSEVEALTPNHFLRGLPAEEREEINVPTSSAEALRDNYKRSQQLSDILWQRWLKEYVPIINHRTKWHAEREKIHEGELVYLVDGNNQRTWIRGVVEKVIPGVDGRIRRALVRTSKGVFRRAVAKLAVMELRSKSDQIASSGPELRGGELLPPPHEHNTSGPTSRPAEKRETKETS
ncbi:uncharacterized protein LOC131679560 [Topomyia yanbarensis]|uniref:uncharacterized protein LOC131679560 n=1 Tax=Topomyia yanbarensis TaxID=2498891 RepID=UPI00273BB873|nr:uncharacterized protein LOC131679560 [Topomyia yanbarensis]